MTEQSDDASPFRRATLPPIPADLLSGAAFEDVLGVPAPELRSGFLIPDAMHNSILAIADNAVPVEPRERVESLDVVKSTYYLSVSPELLKDADALAAGWQKFVFGTPTPEEIAAREAWFAARDAERKRSRAAAVAEWERVRARYADVPAVLAVLDIHQPADDGSLECAHPVFGFESDAEDWPCSTYEAIRDAAR